MFALFLLAAVAALLNHDSAISANTASTELEAARADYVAQAGMQHALWSSQNNACMGDVTIPLTSLGADSYTATISGAPAGTLYKLTPDQDAWIRSDDVTKNNGKTADQHIKFEGGMIEYALTRFDLSTLPKDAQINSAVAWFYVVTSGPGGGAHPEGPLTVHNMTADWTETGATWETMNTSFENSALAMIPAQPVDGVWVSFNLTGQVQAWVNGQPNFGILMASSAEGVHGTYASREEAANPPRLEVVVGSGPASPVTITAQGNLVNGVNRTLEDRVTMAYQPPGAVTLQLGADPGEDAMLDSFYPRNYGASNYIQINADPGFTQRPVLRFSLKGVPTGVKVVSATLELQLLSLNTPGTATAHALARGFEEGTKSGGGVADGATWDTYDGTNNWATAGGDFNSTAVAEANIDSGDSWISWDITDLVGEWLSGAPNYGVLLNGVDSLRQAKFASKEDADPTVRPKLTITYACECGGPCMGLNSSGRLLMVVINPTTLVAADAYKKSLFESWGYTVDVVGESENAAAYAAAAANNDVVYISETVNAKGVGDKVADLPIGVVSEDGDYNDELGFESTNSSFWPVGNSIQLTDTSHYITAPFLIGPLEIYDAYMGGLAIGGTLTTEVQSLADWGSSPGLSVLASGAKTADGGATAGRRVVLPFGRINEMNWSQVNSNGFLVLQRALDWAMNTKSGLRILLVVGIDTALQTRDTARRDLFQSWGHTVTIIDDGANQTEFDAAIALNDVVYVTGTVVDGNLADKLTTSTLGVVNEVGGQLDDLGFHGNATANTVLADNFTATDAGHYISEPFGGSAVTHFTTFISMSVASAPLAPSVGTVGSLATLSWGIPVLGTGSERWDGGLSPGRRVHLPFGEAEISQVTDDGKTLMQRSIEWGAGAGSADPPTVLLLVVVDPSSLTAQESAKKTLMESWGFVVNLIDESASQGEFDDAIAANDVAYVAEDIATGQLGTKLREATIGVVIEEEKITDEFGISSGETTFTEASIEVTDNTHYITQPFSLGAVTFSSSAQPVGGRAGTLAPGLAVLALRPSSTTSMLDAIDEGGVLFDTGTAAGQRVKLPWGGNDFDINSLTVDGQTIMRRAIEWGAGADSPSPGPVAHWKLDDGSGTTAIDSEGGHNGTLTNGPTWMPGHLNGGLDFDGSNDYVNVPHDPTLDLASELTISTWFRADSFGGGVNGYRTFVGKYPSATTANYWFGTWQQELVFGFWSGGVWQEVFTTGLGLSTGEWHQATVSFEDASNQVLLYLDGALVHTGAISQTPPANTGAVQIGRSAAGEYWDGRLDDVRIYDMVLTGADIAALAGGGGGGGGEPCDGTFRDEFNTKTYSANDGTLTWSGDWIEIGESDGPTSGDEQVVTWGTDYTIRTGDNDNGGEGVEREADLTGAAIATLTYDYRRKNLDDTDDYTSVEISVNGVSGPWTEITRHQGPGNDGSFQLISHDISDFISASTRIRFKTSANMGNQDAVHFDNVEIQCAP